MGRSSQHALGTGAIIFSFVVRQITSSSEKYIGLMSGTSMDGVDAVLLDFSTSKPRVLHAEYAQIAPELRAELLALNSAGSDELHRSELACNALMRTYAEAVHELLKKTGLKPQDITALGSHGQTLRHRPQQFDGLGYTLQLCNPALLAELTAITVVADFRRRDVAAGGQGAPLAPLFHRAWFAAENATSIAVLNIGGISNLSFLSPTGKTSGLDCGPGNALLDFWCQKHTGQPYDALGAWGATGQINHQLLHRLQTEPYFALPAPKSTGRDLFNSTWLATHLTSFSHEKPQNIQKTLMELTVWAIEMCASSYEKESSEKLQEIIVCGGGAFNTALMQRLNAPDYFANRALSSEQRGLPPSQVEGAAFAWLARQCLHGVALETSAITGSRGARILGGIYSA